MSIVKDVNVIGGKPRIEGSRVSVEQVYEMYKSRDMKPERISEVLPSLSLKEAGEVIKYMEDRKGEVGTIKDICDQER